MKIYIAGPYSGGDPITNVRRAIRVADALAALGHIPFVPHLTHFWHQISPHRYEFWLDYDMHWLELCDAVYRIDGASPGADREVRRAVEVGMPVYTSLEELEAI